MRIMMNKVVDFLQANPVQYLGTVGRDGKAKCRPFMFCFEKDGKLWFCTNNQKDVYQDRLIRRWKYLFLIPLMRGFVSTAGRFLKIIWR